MRKNINVTTVILLLFVIAGFAVAQHCCKGDQPFH